MHREQYTHIPPLLRPSPTASDATVAGVDFDDLDLDDVPTASQETASQEDGMTQAMDDLNLLLMRANGITPQELADKREKQMEEVERVERVAQEKSRSKVTEGSTFSPSDFSSNVAYRPEAFLWRKP